MFRRLLITTTVCALLLILWPVVGQAVSYSWDNGRPTIKKTIIDHPEYKSCQDKKVTVIKPNATTQYDTVEQNSCVTSGSKLEVGTGVRSDERIVKFRHEKVFRKLNANDYTLLSGTDILSNRVWTGITEQGKLRVFKNLSEVLHPVKSSTGVTVAFDVDWSKVYEPFLDAESGRRSWVYQYVFSENGRYLLAYVDYRGLVHVDTKTGDMKALYSRITDWYGNNYVRELKAISEDGRFIYDKERAVVVDTSKCGVDYSVHFDWKRYYSGFCNTNRFDEDIRTQINEDAPYAARFTDESRTLELYSSKRVGPIFGGENQYMKTEVIMPGYQRAQLEYLAMGDSYSSGEGDVEFKKGKTKRFYKAGTDVVGDYSKGIPKEQCHVSSRSFPYLLAIDSGHLPKMQSVACSGAEIFDIYGWSDRYNSGSYSYDKDGYLGQNRMPRKPGIPRLHGLDAGRQTRLLLDARTHFIPGRIQQQNFLVQAKPEYTTISIGGNDLDFGEIIEGCVRQSPNKTCSYAQKNDSSTKLGGRYDLGDRISYKRLDLVYAYKKLRESSPGTKVYVVGYPQFIARTSSCWKGLLNADEIKMIRESVSYFNSIAKSAAAEAGVYFIDIENVLQGHEMCGVKSDFVMSPPTIPLGSENAELFHPNAKGHMAIFMKIKEGLKGAQSLKDFSNCNGIIICPNAKNTATPERPKYFMRPPSVVERIVRGVNMLQGIGGAVKKKSTQTISTARSLFEKNSSVSGFIFSDPIHIGDFKSNDDGAVYAEIVIPDDVTPGYHTLHLHGTSPSGELVDYYQGVWVTSHLSDDADEDGIPDSEDTCHFIPDTGLDSDRDGIDDACDLKHDKSVQTDVVAHNPGRKHILKSKQKSGSNRSNELSFKKSPIVRSEGGEREKEHKTKDDNEKVAALNRQLVVDDKQTEASKSPEKLVDGRSLTLVIGSIFVFVLVIAILKRNYANIKK